jgi:hypothetical protein
MIVRSVSRPMREKRDMHSRPGRSAKVAKRPLERQLAIGAGDATIHSPEHPRGITRRRDQIRWGACIPDNARRRVNEGNKPSCMCYPGSWIFGPNYYVRPLIVDDQGSVPETEDPFRAITGWL